MNLYLLTQDENDDDDTYDSCVVSAENEDCAKKIIPYGHGRRGLSWASSPENVTCKLIGVSNSEVSKLIISSFNAG